MFALNSRRIAALAVFALAAVSTAGADPIVIDGVTYAVSGATETLNVPFTSPSHVTTGMYSHYVKLKVSGTGQSSATNYNDAFYVFANYLGVPFTPYHGGLYYQLNVSLSTMIPYQQSQQAYKKLVYDVDAGLQVAGVYLPAYRSDHTYEVVIDTGSLNLGKLYFGVADGHFADNSGAYSIEISQLQPALPTITCNGPAVLWSPNHDLIDVSSAFTVDNVNGPTTYTIAVYSDEAEIPETGDGAGKFAPDFKDEHVNGRGILVRSERKGTGNGRYYVATITATNAYGSTTATCLLAVVPHDMTQESLDAVLAEAAASLAGAPYLHGVADPVGTKQ